MKRRRPAEAQEGSAVEDLAAEARAEAVRARRAGMPSSSEPASMAEAEQAARASRDARGTWLPDVDALEAHASMRRARALGRPGGSAERML
jgi:hypothetical protein